MKVFRITTSPMALKHLLRGQLSYMRSKGVDIVMISSDGKDLKETISHENCRHISIPLTRKITPLTDLLATLLLIRLILKEKPDIIHSHTPKAGIVGMLAGYLTRIPIRIHTVAGLPLMEAQGFKKMILNLVETFTYTLATKVYPNSKGLQTYILSKKLTSFSKLKVIGNGSSNGISTEYFDPKKIPIKERLKIRNQLGINKSDFVFIFVGRIVSHKGINELVKAFDQIYKSNDSVKLLLVGPFESDLDPLSKESIYCIENNPHIISTGYQDNVRSLYAISDVLVFPSYREGFPNVVLQAGAMGLPSIVTDINGCNEIIKDGYNGLIISKKNSFELESAMIRIMKSKDLRVMLSKNARPNISRKYDQSIFWKLLLKEYYKLKN